MRNRKLAAWLIACLLLAALSGCGSRQEHGSTGADNYAVIQDDAGRSVALKQKPERIAVTSVSFLEPLHAVGGSVVARPDSKTEIPAFAKDAASIGQVFQIDVERLLASQPDLVVVNKGMNEKLLDPLASNGIPAIVVDMKSYEDVKREIRTFAQVTGEREKGDALIADMDERIRKTIERLPKEKKRVAILHSTAQGLSVQLDGSIAGCIVKMFGWENVASGMEPMEKNPDAAPYSMETLVEQNPEVILVTSMGKIEEIKANMQKMIETNAAWQSIPAIQKGQLYYLPQDLFLLSPGLRYPEAAEMVAKLVCAEAFRK